MEKYGFVYLWYDKKHRRYYIGCHYGKENDGYICSSTWMKSSYKRRPQDFKRRILQTGIERSKLLEEEFKWLSLIEDKELGKKYYNVTKKHFGHWSLDESKRLSMRERNLGVNNPMFGKVGARRGKKHTEETKQKIREARAKQVISKETCIKISNAHKGINNHFYGKKHTEESKQKMSLSHKNRYINA